MILWNFIQQQLLAMTWLNHLVASILEKIGISPSTRFGGSLQFFFYDTLKISILLCILIALISYLQSFFPPERSKRILGNYHGLWANILGALLGTITPFCSCSSIPLFIGFTRAGLSLGVTFSFLISSPMVDLGSFILLMSIFGVKIAAVYVIAGLLVAILGGTLIEKLHMEKYLEEIVHQSTAKNINRTPEYTQRARLQYALEQMKTTFKNVFPYVLIGVAIGAFIHNWIPERWVESLLGNQNPLSVIVAVVIGAPMYADIFGTIPIAEALLTKGACLGTILAFMMSVTTLSLPALILLRKVIKPKLLILFITICIVGITSVGILFNIFQHLFNGGL